MAAQSLVVTIAQINPIVGDLSYNLELIRQAWRETSADTDLIVFSELSLTGYPPEDLLLKPAFIDDVQQALETIIEESKEHSKAILIGALYCERDKLYNGAFLIHKGKTIATTSKHNLPNYGVFDERRYFCPGDLPDPINFLGHRLGIMICEDMWKPDVAEHLKTKGSELLIVLNGSPYENNKQKIRYQHAELRVKKTGLPLIYINQVGGQDELVFDGASFVMNQDGQVILQCEEFVTEYARLQLEKTSQEKWLISSDVTHPLNTETESMYQAVMTGLRDYVEKNRIPGILIGLSGGIDSALSAAIAVDALGTEKVRCIMLPSFYTSQESINDARDCAKKLGVTYDEIPIKSLITEYMNLQPHVRGLAHENLQSRLRGIVLMTLANQSGYIVLSTGNKSEMACGYATLYGDMCGGYNCLKDIYKSQVYNLAQWRNTARPVNALGPDGEVIHKNILTKAPTAELKPGQKDEDSLPPYDILDKILTCLIEEELGIEQTIERGYAPETVEHICKLLLTAEYKRRQSPPGPKVSPRAFGRDRRYPITNGYAGKST